MREPGPDHLEDLHFGPTAAGSRGAYRPGSFDLRLGADESLVDRLVHHHEAQHVLLTSTTAWGAALIVAASTPRWVGLFGELLNGCRTVHESFATYLSCSVVAFGGGNPEDVLAAYPGYGSLLQRLDSFLAAVPGVHRRGLAVTALARSCMQTSVLPAMVREWPEPVALSDLRRMDMPDERLEHLLRQPMSSGAVEAADGVVAAQFGTEALDADVGLGAGALDDRFDDAWAVWEDAAFGAFADQLSGAGATVVGSNDHLPAAAELVALSRAAHPETAIAVEPRPASDRRIVAVVLRHVRLWLTTQRRPARAITVHRDVDLDEVVRVAEATTGVGGRPNLVLSARLPERLLDGYDLPDRDRQAIAAVEGPIVMIRNLADDGNDNGQDVVWLVSFAQPDDIEALAAEWAGRGALTCCVAVSCLADAAWQRRWLPVLQRIGPVVWLIDVEIGALEGELAGRAVQSLYLDLGPSPAGARQALAVKVEGVVGVWLAVADEVGIQMIIQQIADVAPDLRTTGGDWASQLEPVRLVLHDLLHVESFVDLRALSARRT